MSDNRNTLKELPNYFQEFSDAVDELEKVDPHLRCFDEWERGHVKELLHVYPYIEDMKRRIAVVREMVRKAREKKGKQQATPMNGAGVQ